VTTHARSSYLRWAAVLLPGALLWLFPLPGFSAGQSHLLAIFVATIVALVARPMPMAPACFWL